MKALSEIVDGAFYNLKNALTLYTKKKNRSSTLGFSRESM